MSGKPNTEWMKTMIKKLGSREAVRERMGTIGSKGGQNSIGGFGSETINRNGLTGSEQASISGKIGGTISRRRKKTSV